jgi:hypothetical protein
VSTPCGTSGQRSEHSWSADSEEQLQQRQLLLPLPHLLF